MLTSQSNQFIRNFFRGARFTIQQYSNVARNLTDEELALLEDEFSAIVTEYASNEETFKTEFMMAWTKMMIADRFKGPSENACSGVDTPTLEEKGTPAPTPSAGVMASLTTTGFVAVVAGSALALI